MMILLIPILFSVRAAISILTLFYKISTITNLLRMITWFDQGYNSITSQISAWTDIILCDLIAWILSSRLGNFVWMVGAMIFSILFWCPIAIYAFYKSVYDFGPVQRSLWEILTEPVPPERYYVEDQARFLPRPVPRKVCRNKKIFKVKVEPLLLLQR